MTTEFEKNYEKYGYEFPKDEYLNSIHWVNKKLGLDFRMCAKQVLDITDKSLSHPRWHHGGFGISDITSCGVSYDDATKRTAQEIFYLTNKKKLDELKYQKGVEYKNALMSHYNLYLEDSTLPDANLVGLRGKPGVFYRGKPFKK